MSIPRTICYSLRSAIGDGSARQRNSHSLMERRPLRPNGCAVDISYWSHRGRRNYMEDRFVVEHIGSTNKNKENSELITLLAVFDGHGGSAASQFCSDWFSSYVRKNNEHFPQNIPLAMKTAFNKVCVMILFTELPFMCTITDLMKSFLTPDWQWLCEIWLFWWYYCLCSCNRREEGRLLQCR